MIVDCAHHMDGHRAGQGKVPLGEVSDRRAEGGFVWLGLFEPGRRSWPRSARRSGCMSCRS
jgi:magnesium transporter